MHVMNVTEQNYRNGQRLGPEALYVFNPEQLDSYIASFADNGWAVSQSGNTYTLSLPGQDRSIQLTTLEGKDQELQVVKDTRR